MPVLAKLSLFLIAAVTGCTEQPVTGSKAEEEAIKMSDTITYNFDKDTVGKAPLDFSLELTGQGRPGVWVIKETDGRRVLAQTDADRTGYRFPLAVAPKPTVKNLDLSVRFRPVSGEMDQAAGLVWRYQNKDNYYVVRASAKEDNVVLYKVQNGKREDLPLKGEGRTYGKKADVPQGKWSTLRVLAKGNSFTVYLNGARLYEVEDTTFTAPGLVGVWTKADSVTEFDDLTVTPLD
jgi:hypothetical protein